MKPATTTIFFSILLSVLVSSLVLQFSLGHMMDKPKPVEVKKIETGYERVMRTKTLRCGYFAWAPYLIKDANTGKFSGAGHDIIEAMAGGMGFKVDWSLEVAPNDIVAAFNANKIDAHCLTIFEILPRAAVMDFVGPLGYAAIYAYVRGDETRIASLGDIDNPEYTISVLEGEGESALAHARFTKAKFFEAPSSGTSSDKYTNVTAKKADIVITEAQSVLTFLEQNPGALKRATDETLGVFPLVFAVKKGDTQLKETLNQAYHVLQSTGEVDAIWQKYNIADDVVLRPFQPYKTPAQKIIVPASPEPVAAVTIDPAEAAPAEAVSPAETGIPEIPGAVVMPATDAPVVETPAAPVTVEGEVAAP